MSLLAPIARAALFALIVAGAGAAAFRWLVLTRVTTDDRALRSAARIGRASAALLLPTLGVVLLAQFLDFREPTEPAWAEAALLLSLPWGRMWQVQVATALGLLACYVVAGRGARWPWALAALLSMVLCFTPALSGHAAAVEDFTTQAMAADGLHVLAAATWFGTLFVLAVTSLGGRVSASSLFERIRAFSPIALVSACVIAATGTFGAWLHLSHPRDLIASEYGRLLSLKLVIFACVVAVGAFNWRRATPRLADGDRSFIARGIATELALVAVVIAITAWFVATSPPELP